MRNPNRSMNFFVPSLRLAGVFVLALSAVLPSLKADPLAVTLLLEDGKRRIGYIANSNERALLFQATPEGGQRTAIPYTQLRGVAFTDEGDIMGPARYAYSRSNYEEAAKLFAEVADEYSFIWGIGRDLLGNFACEARFFHIDCLRRLGRYSEIGDAMETKTGQALEDGIPEVLLPKLKIFRLWKHYADENWEALKSGLQTYEETLSGKKAELLRVPPFNDSDPAILVQLHFMRGKLFEAEEQKQDALNELYRAALLDYGSDHQVSEQSLQSALEIQTSDPGVAESQAKQMEIYAVATVFRDAYNQGDLPLRFQDYAKEPEALKKRRLEEEARLKEQAEAEAARAKEEAEAAAAALEKKKPAFQSKDKNKDGNVTIDEFFGKPKNKLNKKQKSRFASLDENKDGALSLEEFPEEN